MCPTETGDEASATTRRVSAATAAASPSVPVYRVVDAAELAYLRAVGDFGSNPSSSGKYFALTLSGAQAFARHPMNAGSRITQIELPLSIVLQGWHFVDLGLFGAGSSVFFEEVQLHVVYGAMTVPAIL